MKSLLINNMSWETSSHSWDVTISSLPATYRVNVVVIDDKGRAKYLTRYFKRFDKVEDFIDVLKVLEKIPAKNAEREPQPDA